jgi:hypothetical protein
MKKLIALFLVLSLLILSGNLYAKKKGAAIKVFKIDGLQVGGELIAVKVNSLLLLSESGADVSVYIRDVNVIKIIKKPKTTWGAGLGLFMGVAPGASIGYRVGWRTLAGAFWGGVIGGLAGAIVGGFIGASLGKEVTIQIEGKSDTEIKEILEDLRSKARVPDYK